jgi:hypothetical protein
MSNELNSELRDLVSTVALLPPDCRALVESKVQAVIATHQRRTRILTLVQEALAQLRLDMKYLVFDLEATRRERDDYKQRCGD